MRKTILAGFAAMLPLLASAEEIAIFPVKLLDTSKEARDQSVEHERRLNILTEILESELDGAVPIDRQAVAGCQPETTDCLLLLARKSEAERAVFVVVQKSSTLILQIFANLVDVRTGELITSRDLNFRGDNDEAWRRAGRFLARQMRDTSN